MAKVISRTKDEEDYKLDVTLRPQSFSQFVGQTKTTNNLKIYIEAALKRGDSLDHILFSGLPGLGKTTLAHLVAQELKTNLKITSGPVLERPADLAGLLTNLNPNDVLFIDEIHRLGRIVEEYLYSAMEDFAINIMIDQGPHARTMRIDVPKFTLIGATTREGLLTDAFRARFGIFEKLELYPWPDLVKIVKRSAQLLTVQINQDSTEIIARRSRGTPRVVNRLLKRVRDLAQVKANNVIMREIAEEGLERLGIDEAGLETTDRKILKTILAYGGKPVGLKTIAVAVGEEEDTIEEVYEPYLIQCSFLEKTSRGRRITMAACKHLKEPIPPSLKQNGLF